MKSPSIWTLKELVNFTKEVSVKIDGEWYPSRPLGLDTIGNRFKCAWLVFVGKADAVIWPKGQ